MKFGQILVSCMKNISNVSGSVLKWKLVPGPLMIKIKI